MSLHETYKQLQHKLQIIYENREAENIANAVMKSITGLSRLERMMQKDLQITQEQSIKINNCTTELLLHKPMQYVLQEAWFAEMKFYVDENVLIPRPETEELCEWIVLNEKSKVKSKKSKIKPQTSLILDIGTGSGCIAITLKKKIPDVEVFALDISKKALQVAKKNASLNNTEIHFFCLNILNKENWKPLPQFNIIVSNPPYIKQSEAAAMQKNVLNYEPHTALFVADEDAFIFYNKIATFAQHHLKKFGELYFEINEAYSNEVFTIMKDLGFKNIELKKDMQGKNRMIRGEKGI